MSKKRIHAYAASFGADLAAKIIEQFAEENSTILDPFTGSGTTLIQALSAGHRAIGVDVDPIACLIARTQTRKYDADWLKDVGELFSKELTELEREMKTLPAYLRDLRPGAEVRVNGYIGSVPDKPSIDYWFTPTQRATLAALTALCKSLRGPRRQILRVAISSAIVRKWPSTLSRAMDIDHSRPHRGTPVHRSLSQQFTLFRRILNEVISGLIRLASTSQAWTHEAEIIQGDSATSLFQLNPETANLILTSPP